MKPSLKMYVGLYVVLMLAVVPLVLRWVPPNRWYGVRVPGLMLEPEHWYDINALGGKLFGGAMFVCLLINLMLRFAPESVLRYTHWINGALLLISFWGVTLQLMQSVS